jgi:hypothetical protein
MTPMEAFERCAVRVEHPTGRVGVPTMSRNLEMNRK